MHNLRVFSQIGKLSNLLKQFYLNLLTNAFSQNGYKPSIPVQYANLMEFSSLKSTDMRTQTYSLLYSQHSQ